MTDGGGTSRLVAGDIEVEEPQSNAEDRAAAEVRIRTQAPRLCRSAVSRQAARAYGVARLRDYFSIPHLNRPVPVCGGFRIVRDHQNGLPQPLVEIAHDFEHGL